VRVRLRGRGGPADGLSKEAAVSLLYYLCRFSNCPRFQKSRHKVDRPAGIISGLWSGREGEKVGTQLSQACINGLLSQTCTLPHTNIMFAGQTTAQPKTVFWVVRNPVLVGVMYNVSIWSSCVWSRRHGDAGQRCFVYNASRHVCACACRQYSVECY